MDETSPVHLYTDASLQGIGGYLCQIVNGVEQPIAFYSKSLTKEERNWGIPCLEGYAIYKAFMEFDYLLRDAHTHVHTDHANLLYIRDSKETKVIRWKLELQEYRFDLEFIKGKDNGIADFMSRNDAAELDDYVDETPKRTVNMLCNLWLKECDIATVSKVPVCAVLRNHKKVFVIPSDKYDILERVHNKMSGHHGVEYTLNKLAKLKEQWQYMREHVKRFIHECPICQKATYNSYKVKIPRFVSGRYLPFERVAIDTIGPMQEDAEGNQYIIAVIDSFSRFLCLYPCKSVTAEEAARTIMIHVGYFGVPCEILSDNGSQYVNEIIQELLDFIGSEHITTMAYSKEENSIVERSNKETWRWLRAMIQDKNIGKKNWSKTIPFVARIHNSTTVASLGYSPGQIIFGDRVELDSNILLPRVNRQQSDINIHDWMKDRLIIQDQVIELAQRLQRERDDEHLQQREESLTHFDVGSYVLVAYPDTNYGQRRPDKLHMMLKGPFKVVGRNLNEYLLLNLVTKKEETKSIFLLRPFYYNAARIKPEDVALQDYEDEFVVEKIISHEGNWNRKSLLTFTVKWVGYEVATPNQKWMDLRLNEKLHDYLRQQGHARLIPKECLDLRDKDISIKRAKTAKL